MKMAQKIERILVVENNLAYIDAAKSYFASLPDVQAEFIIDYENAKKALPGYKGGKALIDLFIPESMQEKLGKEGHGLIKQIKSKLNIDDFMIETIKKTDKELAGSVADFVGKEDINALTGEDLKKLPPFDYNIIVGGAYGPEGSRIKDYLSAIAAEETKGHAPLGILLGKEAQKLGIPFIFVTDASGHNQAHDAIRELFFTGDRSKFVYGYGKKDLEVWKKAYESIKNGEIDK
jgi:hypothetical protein